MSDTYTCAHCGGCFQKGWTDEEAEAEMRDTFGELAPEERAIICDDCHKRLQTWMAEERDAAELALDDDIDPRQIDIFDTRAGDAS